MKNAVQLMEKETEKPAAPKLRAVEPVARRDLVSLATMSKTELDEVFDNAFEVLPEEVAGREYNGFNHPVFTSFLGIRKFRKGFKQVAGELRGYNIKVLQNGSPMNAWIPLKQPDGTDIRHGFYLVEPAGPGCADTEALFLDYGRGNNPLLDPSALLRDYLRKLEPDNADVLLGRAYLALGGREVFMSYFLLQYERPVPY